MNWLKALRLIVVCLFVITANAQKLATAPTTSSSSSSSSSTLAAPGWLSGSSYQVGLLPTAVAVGDFNGDGRLDLAVASDSGTGTSGSVAVLLGNGDGTFQPQVSYTVGFTCNGIAAADLNGDGRLDLVVPCSYNSTVAVLLGNGDGTFQSAVTYATAAGPWSVAVTDFDLDGKADLAVVAASGMVSILRGNGDGTFQSHVDYSVGKTSLALAVGDFNNDGWPDIAVANDDVSGPSTVSVLLGNGNATFSSQVQYTVGDGAKSLVAGDFNRDGKLDLAVVNFTGNSISVLLGNGDGSFQPQVTYPAGIEPTAVAAADFNGDGVVDLVVCSTYSDKASILLGKGDGTFAFPLSYGTGVGPTGLAVGDFNGDGRPDVAVANGTVNTVSALVQSTAALSATDVLFSSQLIRTRSAAQRITLTNLGAAPMSVISIASNSTEFPVQSSCPATLQAGASCTIKVTFAPATAGAKAATLRVADSAGSSPQKIVLAGLATGN